MFGLETIESRALTLLLKEPAEERPRLLQMAENRMQEVGIDPHLSSDRPHQGVHDLIGSNAALPDWMRARLVSEENVLNAEDFQDLIDRLVPAYPDR